jgi:AcrR family transcriptional regulator
VLRRSQVSRSSLYHHFANREGFIAALEFENSVRRNMTEMEQMRTFILGSADREQVMQAIEFALAADGGESARARRQRRVESLAASGYSKQLREMLKEAQIAGSQYFAETLRLAVERGLVDTKLPVDGIAYAIQSMLVGRILVDITEDQSIDRNWAVTITEAIRHLLSPH